MKTQNRKCATVLQEHGSANGSIEEGLAESKLVDPKLRSLQEEIDNPNLSVGHPRSLGYFFKCDPPSFQTRQANERLEIVVVIRCAFKALQLSAMQFAMENAKDQRSWRVCLST